MIHLLQLSPLWGTVSLTCSVFKAIIQSITDNPSFILSLKLNYLKLVYSVTSLHPGDLSTNILSGWLSVQAPLFSTEIFFPI